jgi:ATP-dependent helicase/nuclease subunit B
VSAIETWIANPYTIFAQRILKLDPLPRLGRMPGANLRGTIVHAALGRFAERFPSALPDDIRRELMAIARDEFAAYKSHPRIGSFWMQRFERFAEWFAATEAARRRAGNDNDEAAGKVIGEVEGKLVLATGGDNFTLTARADRIDIGADGIWITDYKTAAQLDGLVRSAKENRSPQLPLEAAIAIADGFAGIAGLPVEGLRYISASGGEPAGLEKEVDVDDVAAFAERALDDLKALVARFDQPETPYRAVRRPHFRYEYDAYAQLARVAEWACADSDAGEG